MSDEEVNRIAAAVLNRLDERSGPQVTPEKKSVNPWIAAVVASVISGGGGMFGGAELVNKEVLILQTKVEQLEAQEKKTAQKLERLENQVQGVRIGLAAAGIIKVSQ